MSKLSSNRSLLAICLHCFYHVPKLYVYKVGCHAIERFDFVYSFFFWLFECERNIKIKGLPLISISPIYGWLIWKIFHLKFWYM